MFERLSKLLGGRNCHWSSGDDEPESQPVSLLQTLDSKVAHWAFLRGFFYSSKSGGEVFTLTGTTGDFDWKLECVPSQRDYMSGMELRGRAEAKVTDDVTVLVMNRVLKDTLEKKAFSLYTDTLQTEVKPELCEEMRWLAVYPEGGWDSLPDPFWSRYAVMSDRRHYAQRWLNPKMTSILMALPETSFYAPIPTMLMLMRGKVHVRIQYSPLDISTLELAVQLLNEGSAVAKALAQ